MKIMMFQRFSIFLMQYILIASASSFIALDSKRPKCVIVDSYVSATLAIVYSTPDLIALPKDDSYDHFSGRDGGETEMMEEMRKRKRRHEEKIKGMEDMIPTFKSLDTTNSLEGGISNLSIVIEEILAENEPHKGRRVTHSFQIREDKGTLKYKLKSLDSAKICIQSLTASAHKPTFFSLRVKEIDEEDISKMEKADEAYTKLLSEYNNRNREALLHLEWIEKEIKRTVNEVNKLMGHSKASKERNIKFHEASVSAKKDLAFWKKLQILILIIFGAFNMSSLIKHLKLKGIIY